MTSIQIDRHDGLSSSVAIKGPCKVASSTNITLAAEQTIDGVAVVSGDRVLVMGQTNPVDNGIWKVSTGVWTRAKDFAGNRDVKKGTTVVVTGGTQAGAWQVTTADPITVGTTSIAFSQTLQPYDADLAALAGIGTSVQGDLIYANGAGTWARLAKGRALQGLRQNSADTAPEWGDFAPGYDVNGFAGANESAKIAALYAAAPTNPYVYRSDSHVGIIRDTAPLNYQGTRAAFVLQRRDTGSGGTNELIPGAVFQFTSTGDGVVTAGSDLSQTIWMGLTSTHTKTGDGSGSVFQAIGSLGAYGAGTYNELGGFVGEFTNTGSNHGTMSGVEVLVKDGVDNTTNFDTTMSGVIARIRRWNAGTRRVVNFMASSEGDTAPESAYAFSPGGFATWLRGMDFRNSTFTTGQAILLKNNDGIAAMNAAGTTAQTVFFLDTTDNTWVAAGGKSKAVFVSNSDFEKQFSVLSTDNAANYFEASGAVSGQNPLYWVKGTDTDIGTAFASKGAGVHNFYTGGASFYKQAEIGHVASAANYLQFKGAIATGSPTISALGSDTNIDLTLTPKGTGAVRTAAAVLSSGATAGVGYSTGAGGTVTQATSKSTGVTLNKTCGQITMNAAALAAGAKVSFVVTNSAVAATDVVIASVASGGTANAYRAAVTATAAGSFTVTVENITAGSLSEAPVISYAVVKAVTA
ncbi:hypothetical protein [Mesorhizobium sp. M4B.F.Ca.ET.017.02.2.1]|uniref:hypothetical protein n=1 Tax=Mesorhizobium sp. M4B.F.Ca.ET.017.02.2.1 TaxID=2496649 RepID=UPI001AECA414|nr:hypothetical protein [Mesorhizobium sp. M4B.F.Ca.ET.017.02.2.1]